MPKLHVALLVGPPQEKPSPDDLEIVPDVLDLLEAPLQKFMTGKQFLVSACAFGTTTQGLFADRPLMESRAKADKLSPRLNLTETFNSLPPIDCILSYSPHFLSNEYRKMLTQLCPRILEIYTKGQGIAFRSSTWGRDPSINAYDSIVFNPSNQTFNTTLEEKITSLLDPHANTIITVQFNPDAILPTLDRTPKTPPNSMD